MADKAERRICRKTGRIIKAAEVAARLGRSVRTAQRMWAEPREQYEARGLSRRKPWEAEGISRATWYRRRQEDGPPTLNNSTAKSATPLAEKRRAKTMHCMKTATANDRIGLNGHPNRPPALADLAETATAGMAEMQDRGE